MSSEDEQASSDSDGGDGPEDPIAVAVAKPNDGTGMKCQQCDSSSLSTDPIDATKISGPRSYAL